MKLLKSGMYLLLWVFLLVIFFAFKSNAQQEKDISIADAPLNFLTTDTGVEFAMLGKKPATPAPTLFNFVKSVERLKDPRYHNRVGDVLIKKGYVIISMDIPCHGSDAKGNGVLFPQGFDCWRIELEMGNNVIAQFCDKFSQVLDYLISEGYTDSTKVATCGISRCGFIAFHVAAHDQRIKCAAGFAPVTDLRVLHEFYGMENHRLTCSLSLINFADNFLGRSIYLLIGDNDERVSPDHAISFVRRVAIYSAKKGIDTNVELHVLHENRNHALPDPENSLQHAAEWIDKQLNN